MEAQTVRQPARDDRANPLRGLDRDRFGNRIDPAVGYARGTIITDEVAETRRQEQAYGIIRERYARLGDDGIFNLTGLIRAFPYADGDEQAMRSYVHYIARSPVRLEELALERLGGDPGRHAGFLATRVSAAMLAIMLAVLRRGDSVLSLVPGDRSHPSIRQAVELAGGQFHEVTCTDDLAALLTRERPRLIVITAISPSKRHLALADTERAIALAHSAGALVLLDDAHMAARLAIYGEPPGLALGADLTVWSLDKHLPGPRSGFVAGSRALALRVKARALSLGIEGQLGQCIAAYRALEAFDPAPVRAAASLAEQLFSAIQPDMEGRGYLAGAGVALSGEDFLGLALRRAGAERSPLAPIEAIAYGALAMLRSHGAITIPAVGMPGAACTFRLMMYPDGARLGASAILSAWRTSLAAVAEGLSTPDKVRNSLLGSA